MPRQFYIRDRADSRRKRELRFTERPLMAGPGLRALYAAEITQSSVRPDSKALKTEAKAA